MSQRIHDPTETGLPEYSTTGTLREILEELKDGPDFHITVEEVYEMDPDWFGEREKVILMSKINRWSQTGENISGWDEKLVRISRARARAMERLVEEGFNELGKKYREMDITARRSMAGWIAELPRDPVHVPPGELLG